MAKAAKDPTEPIRLKASAYPNVDKGTACTQSSFKANGKAFLFIGEQGGRSKAMFKLDASMAEAMKLAKQHPDDYQVGSSSWVTARFSAAKPMPTRLWKKWLDESYALTAKSPAGEKKSSKKKTSTKKAARKTAAKKKATGKKPAKKARR